MAIYLPFVKLTTGKYLIGTTQRNLTMKGSDVLIRTGKGNMSLPDYLKHYSKQECGKLQKLIKKGDGTFKNTVISILKKNNTSKEVIALYDRTCRAEIDEQF